MQILADENIPYVRELFSTLGEIRTIAGRSLQQTDLTNIDVLLVRSVTPVNANLLKNTQIKFVGTATIGYDHIDLNFLEKHRIGFSYAPGCNATAAAEYVISSLIIMSERQGFDLTNKTVGIIGCGNVGSRVWQKLQALGVTCLRHDPPLQEKLGNQDFVDLNRVLTADIITLHVPLEKAGPYPTYLMVNQAFLAKLHPETLFINTSRGAIVDEVALLHKLTQCPKMTAILDVWANEPTINQILLQRSNLGTPHIAGYSFDGKITGTTMLYQAICRHFACIPTARIPLPPAPLTGLSFSQTVDDKTAIQTAVLAAYDVRRDDAALRLSAQTANPANAFDLLRKNYPIRREFHNITISLPKEKLLLANKMQQLGFNISFSA